MSTDLGNALSDALNGIDSLVGKEKEGNTIKLVDMSNTELQKVYNHSTDMLGNNDRFLPGKYICKRNIRNLINNCNAELLKRYILKELNIDVLKTNIQLIDYIRVIKDSNNLNGADSVNNLFVNLPSEYSSVTIDMLLEACFDKLSVINRKMITDKFILSQGIWLTDSEKEDLTEIVNGKRRNWMDVIRERLVLNNIKLRVDPNGFSYNEFRSLIHLPRISKISDLPSDTVKFLRDKVFILLDADTDFYIEKWSKIISDIEKVAKEKGYTLTKNNYDLSSN